MTPPIRPGPAAAATPSMREADAGLVHGAPDDAVEQFDMGARRDLRHHAAERRVVGGLRMHDIGQDPARAVLAGARPRRPRFRRRWSRFRGRASAGGGPNSVLVATGSFKALSVARVAFGAKVHRPAARASAPTRTAMAILVTRPQPDKTTARRCAPGGMRCWRRRCCGSRRCRFGTRRRAYGAVIVTSANALRAIDAAAAAGYGTAAVRGRRAHRGRRARRGSQGDFRRRRRRRAARSHAGRRKRRC